MGFFIYSLFNLSVLSSNPKVKSLNMAASATMSSSSFTAAGLVPRLGSKPHSAPIFLLPHRQTMRVHCQAGQQPPPEQPTPVSPPSPPPTAATPPPAPKPAAAKVSTRFNDVLAFSGPAPERINGRLAMVGFVSAVAVEAVRGDGLLSQLGDGGVSWFVLTAGVLTAASLVPLFKGVSVQSKYSGGLFTADAELWNGRFAMLGLVGLAFTEYLTGGPLV